MQKEALCRFVNCMNNNHFNYTLAFGSILGAIREHGFIKFDLDIDTFIWIEDYSNEIIKELQKTGFKWVHSMLVEDGRFGREDTFQYKGVSIDIFYLYPPISELPYCCDFVRKEGMGKDERMPRRVEMPVSKKRRIELFEGMEVYVPVNAEQICEYRYGSSYLTPNPNWHWNTSENAIVEWPEMIESTIFAANPSLNSEK